MKRVVKVRYRSLDRKRVSLDGKSCVDCGATSQLTRDHDWCAEGFPVVIRCKQCHKAKDRQVGRQAECPVCGQVKYGKRKLWHHLRRKHGINGKEKRALAKEARAGSGVRVPREVPQ